MIEQDKLEELRYEWRVLLRPFNVPPALRDEIFADLLKHYREEGRAYHNMKHIWNVLSAVEQMKRFLQDETAVRLAAWFHDVIYDVQASDNEDKSAHYARQMMRRMNLPHPLIQRVTELIMATKAHCAPADDIDCQVLLDADLATFAAEDGEYDQYADGIRQEFHFVPEQHYKVERVKILNKFLARERIFWTDFMYQHHEQQARHNIHEEIASLS